MVVEDDESTAELLLHFLHREGYETWYAADGFAAQKLVQENNAPALAILDIMLPYKDGISLVQQIRAKDGWGSVPIIMLTAKSDEQDVVKALDSGATDYVVKPFQPKALMARIRRLVEPDA
ncbi:MAG: response regulator transcription factor [Gammaproteobacteria bacterium]|nr:response regulator transcription factor [Gammaproteobacteria bacterium]